MATSSRAEVEPSLAVDYGDCDEEVPLPVEGIAVADEPHGDRSGDETKPQQEAKRPRRVEAALKGSPTFEVHAPLLCAERSTWSSHRDKEEQVGNGGA